jgi:hypothetical protein
MSTKKYILIKNNHGFFVGEVKNKRIMSYSTVEVLIGVLVEVLEAISINIPSILLVYVLLRTSKVYYFLKSAL